MPDFLLLSGQVLRVRVKWSDSKAGKAAFTELAEKYSGQELADQYEALTCHGRRLGPHCRGLVSNAI